MTTVDFEAQVSLKCSGSVGHTGRLNDLEGVLETFGGIELCKLVCLFFATSHLRAQKS